MKKQYILGLVAFLAITLCTYAQRDNGVRSGFKTGVNFSSLNSDADFEGIEDDRIGYHATFFVEFPINDVLAFQPELQYSAQGGKEEEFRANYINLPLTVKLNLIDYFNIHIGGQAGVKIWEWEQEDNFDALNYAALGGIGINLNESIFIEGRYVYGFANLLEEDNEFSIQEDVTNSYIQVSLGIRL